MANAEESPLGDMLRDYNGKELVGDGAIKMPIHYEEMIHNLALGRCLTLRGRNTQHYHESSTQVDPDVTGGETGFAEEYMRECYAQEYNYLLMGLAQCALDTRTKDVAFNDDNLDVAALYCMDRRVDEYSRRGVYGDHQWAKEVELH